MYREGGGVKSVRVTLLRLGTPKEEIASPDTPLPRVFDGLRAMLLASLMDRLPSPLHTMGWYWVL